MELLAWVFECGAGAGCWCGRWVLVRVLYNLSHWGFMRFNVPTLGFLWVIEAVLCPECNVSIGADFSIEESKGCFTWCHNQGEG